jgi:hypothetical protein
MRDRKKLRRQYKKLALMMLQRRLEDLASPTVGRIFTAVLLNALALLSAGVPKFS